MVLTNWTCSVLVGSLYGKIYLIILMTFTVYAEALLSLSTGVQYELTWFPWSMCWSILLTIFVTHWYSVRHWRNLQHIIHESPRTKLCQKWGMQEQCPINLPRKSRSDGQTLLYWNMEVHCLLEKSWYHQFDTVAVTSRRADKQEAFMHTVWPV